jgi:hypothetical protein
VSTIGIGAASSGEGDSVSGFGSGVCSSVGGRSAGGNVGSAGSELELCRSVLLFADGVACDARNGAAAIGLAGSAEIGSIETRFAALGSTEIGLKSFDGSIDGSSTFGFVFFLGLN